ncbi:CGNR zinc finger domain-containing protein [Streptomyces griseus]
MPNGSSRLERWCTTAVCGNREKARRHDERTR